MLVYLVAIILGIVAGTITGLLPGVHINLVAALVTGSALITSLFAPLPLAFFIVALAITHTFLDFIPSIYLGAPDEDTFLSVLPGHALLREGRGHEAVLLTLSGSAAALVLVVLASPIFIYLLPQIQQKIIFLIPFIIIFISVYMIAREERWMTAAIVFALAGFLGYATLNLPIKEPLLPLLTGLFGASAMVISAKEKSPLLPQKEISLKEIEWNKKDIRNAIIGTSLIAPVCSFLPAVGSGYASLISSEIFEQSKRGFLMLNGLMNSFVMVSSFVLIFSINKARTGAAAAIRELLTNISLAQISILVGVSILTGAIAFLIGTMISKQCSNIISKVNYQKISIAVLIFLLILTLMLSGPIGAIVLATSTSLGIFAIKSGIKRTHLMACLLIPTILYYLAY